MCLCDVVISAWSLVPAWSSWPISSVQLPTPAASPALQHKDSSLLSSCTDCRALLLSLHRDIMIQRTGFVVAWLKAFLRDRAAEASCGQAARRTGCSLQPGLCYTKMQLLWTPQASCCRVQCRLLRSVCVCATELWASAPAPAGFYGSQVCCSSYSLAQTISVLETQTMSKFLFSQPVNFPAVKSRSGPLQPKAQSLQNKKHF